MIQQQTVKLAITPAQIAFHYAKIIGNFGGEINGTVRSAWKCSGLSGPRPEVVFFDGSVWSDRNLLFLFQKFSFPAVLC